MVGLRWLSPTVLSAGLLTVLSFPATAADSLYFGGGTPVRFHAASHSSPVFPK